jgi:sugar phosphate isomerase/epimerase
MLDGDWRALVRQARDLLDGHTGRLGIHGPFDGLTLLSRDAKVRALTTQRLCAGVEFAAEIGATHMVVHSPFLFFGSAFAPHGPGSRRAEDTELAHATLQPVLSLAAQANCTLVLENILDTNPAPLLALVRSFESHYVRLSVDTGHAFITHHRGGATPDQWVREAGALLEHIHVQDTDGNLDRHWAVGNGSINWHAVFEAIGGLEQHPRLLLEVRNKADIARSTRWLVEHGFAR